MPGYYEFGRLSHILRFEYRGSKWVFVGICILSNPHDLPPLNFIDNSFSLICRCIEVNIWLQFIRQKDMLMIYAGN